MQNVGMVKHIILWTLKPELSGSEKQKIRREIKSGLEELNGKIPGLLKIKVNVDGRLDSSNADLMLDSTFTDQDALRNYSVNPLHVAVADSKVRPFASVRSCLDFEIQQEDE